MSQVVIDVPNDLLLTLREQPEAVASAARLTAAIYYLNEKRLSLGQAARLAGLTRLEFLDVLVAQGIPAFDLPSTDAAAEVNAAQRTIIHNCR